MYSGLLWERLSVIERADFKYSIKLRTSISALVGLKTERNHNSMGF